MYSYAGVAASPVGDAGFEFIELNEFNVLGVVLKPALIYLNMFELILPEAMAAPVTPAAQQGSIFGLLIPFVLLGLFMWLFVFRPQRRQRREHGQMLDALQPGDEVITSGGIVGRVSALQRNWVIVEVAEGVLLRMQRHAILSILPKGTIDEDPSAEA